MSSFLTCVRQLLGVARLPLWAGPAIVFLGLASALSEGIGLYLFIPLLESLGASSAVGSGVSQSLASKLVAWAPGPNTIPFLLLLVIGAVVVKNIIVISNSYVTRRVNGLVAHRLRLQIFEQTISSCFDYKSGNRRTDVINTLTTNVKDTSRALELFFRVTICSCTFVVFICLLFAISAQLTFVSLLFLALTALLITIVTRRSEALGYHVVEENKKFVLRMWENIQGLQVIRSFAQENREVNRFQELSNGIRRKVLHLEMLGELPIPLAEICAAVLIAALVLVAVHIGAGIATLAAFLAVLYRLQSPVREFLQTKVLVQALAGSVNDVSAYIEATREPWIPSGATSAAPVKSGIEFRDVSLQYAPDQPPALEGVSLAIPAGKTTAIVGRSGAGKSTLMSLLYRFVDPSGGEILIDGVPLTQLELSSWRERLSIMPQDVLLFNASVKENIAYGRPAADESEIRQAASIAAAHDFVEALPAGYDTHLGDDGARLSGGQKQRIALARAILRDADVLLLDEATNALDAESENAFQVALETFSHGRTIVVIAHSLHTVEQADHVIVLEAGRVVQSGTPAELLSKSGHFARLYSLQNRSRESVPTV